MTRAEDIDMSQVHDGRGPKAEESTTGFDIVLTINEPDGETEHEASVETMAQLPEAIDVLTAGRNWTSLVVVVSHK